MMVEGSASRPEGRFATVNGLRLHYRETPGERGPLLCLHGITSNARAWDGLAAELAPEYRVLAPDLRGRGDNDKPAGPYGLDVHAADAVALLDSLGIGRASVIGHSLGALIGMQLAAGYPDRIAKLVLVDHGVNTPPETIAALRPFWARLSRSYPSWTRCAPRRPTRAGRRRSSATSKGTRRSSRMGRSATRSRPGCRSGT